MAKRTKFSASELVAPYLIHGVEGVENHPKFADAADPRPQLKKLIEMLNEYETANVEPLVSMLDRLNAEKASNRGGSKRTPVTVADNTPRKFKVGNRETRPQVVIPLPADCNFFDSDKVSVRFLADEIIITALES